VSPLLFLALAGVYVLGVAGVVAAGSMPGSIVKSAPVAAADLEERLAAIRSEPVAERFLMARQSRRRDDAMKSLHRVVESLERAFTPVTARRTRSDVAAPGSLRATRSH
jgi:hypothetical protein